MKATFPVSPSHSTSDAFALYKRDVAQYPLLTPEEEVSLARRIQAGDEEAREQMIRSNLRLVIRIARDYEHLGLPLLDLINEGNLGLMRAVEKFDPDKGAKLSTYSAWYIKLAIRRALSQQGKTIRIPINAVDQSSQMRKAEAGLRERLGRDATEEELAESLGLSVQRVNLLRQSAIRPASLDAMLNDDNDGSLAEMIADERAESPDETTVNQEAVERIQDLVSRLPKRESEIIRQRFGLDGGARQTLDHIGHHLGVSRERIRQLQNQTLQKLREMLESSEAGQVAA